MRKGLLDLVGMRPYLLGLLFAASASANTTLTFNGTITAGPAFVGEAVSYTFELSDNPAAASSFPYYYDESLSDVDLYNNISGSFITGNWVRPTVGFTDPKSYISVASDTLIISAENNASYNIGLSFNGSFINLITIGIRFSNDPLTEPVSDYSQLFSGTSGVYTVTNIGSYISMSDSSFYTLNISGLTINAAPIPEPSTYGLALGGLALVGAAIRRRRTTAK